MGELPHKPTPFSIWLQLKTIPDKNGSGEKKRKAAVWAGTILASNNDEDCEKYPLKYATGVPVYQEVSRASSLSRQSILSDVVQSHNRAIRELAFVRACTHASYRWKLAIIMNGIETLDDAINIARIICLENRGPTKILTYIMAFCEVFREYKLYSDPKVILDYEPVYWRYVQMDGVFAIESCQKIPQPPHDSAQEQQSSPPHKALEDKENVACTSATA